MKIFLDLEDTIITTWDEALLIHDGALRSWLRSFGVGEVSIFSFAIWDDKDKAHFVNSNMKSMIERALEVQVVEWLSVDEQAKISQQSTGIHWLDRKDFMQLRGKHGAFIDVCKAREQQELCVLIDDAVPRETIVAHDKGLTLELIPVHWITNS